MNNIFTKDTLPRLRTFVKYGLPMMAFTAASFFTSCSEDDIIDPLPPEPTPTSRDTVTHVADARTLDLAGFSAAVQKDLNDTKKYVKSASITGDFGIREGDFLAMRDLGKIKKTLGNRFKMDRVYPVVADILLRSDEWNKWGKINLAKSPNGDSFVVLESEKGMFGDQPIKVDQSTQGLTQIGSIDYGADGAVLSKYLPDTIIHSVNGADAAALLKLKSAAMGKKIIIRTKRDKNGKQPIWSNMNNAVMNLWESPGAMDFTGSGMSIVYQFEEDPIITEYIFSGDVAKFKPLDITGGLYDEFAGNQNYLKLVNSETKAERYPSERPNIVATGVVDVYLPQTLEYKNPSGIDTGGLRDDEMTGQYFKANERTMINPATERYINVVYTQHAAGHLSQNYNKISLAFAQPEKIMFVLPARYSIEVLSPKVSHDEKCDLMKQLLMRVLKMDVGGDHRLLEMADDVRVAPLAAAAGRKIR